MWEHYDTGNTKAAFEDQMAVVCWFNDLINFGKCWNTVPHQQLKNFFYDNQTKVVPM
jgi:hypothetical protein